MDEFGVLDQLIYDHASDSSAESIARVLGLVHLYRASGVHLLAFFTFLDFALQWLFKSLGLDPKRGKLSSLLLTGFAIFWIWKLQDFRLTLIRPIFTFLIRQFFENRGARSQIIVPLVLTFVFECLLSKSTSFTEGAFHYYASVMGGLLAYFLSKDVRPVFKHLNLAIGSWIPIAILSLVRSHLVSYLTPIYSLITIPVITLFLYPLTLVDILIHGTISTGVIQIWNAFLHGLFALPELGLTFASVSMQAVWVALPLAFAFSFFCTKIPKPTWIFMLLALGLGTIGRAELVHWKPKHQLVQLDVHQGDAAIMKENPGRIEMVDVGGLRTYEPGKWLEKLSQFQTASIDGILLSHLDEDHVGALRELLLLVPVRCIETNHEHWASEKGIRLSNWIHEHASETTLDDSGCIRLSRVGWFRSTRSSGNELMGGMVTPLSKGHAYFALGDGDEAQELSYEKYFHADIASFPSRIWKVSHHGSRFSSNLPFLERLNPEELWISVGAHNPYHHPNPLTLWKLSTLSGRVYRTDVAGDISRSFNE